MVSFEDFKKLDIRVAKIVDVKEHPNADKLYIIQINLGDETKRLVAGLRPRYSSSDLMGKNVVVVTNLEPAVIRGEESNALLLAAMADDGPVILISEQEVNPGAVVK